MSRVVDRRYRLMREIARGGIGIVYEAEHAYTGRRVALKVLTEEYATNGVARERLLREARALELARHPGVVALLDAGDEPGEGPYFVMELLEGRTLAGLVTARGSLPIHDVCRVAFRLCETVAAVHERGLVHRDIKPSNVFITKGEYGEEVKLIDFGIAQFSGEALPAVNNKLTKPNEIVGTPEYMSPEQLLARPDQDHRTDIYALGVTLYECLVGAVPFDGNAVEVLLKVSTDAPRSPAELRPDVPLPLADAILRSCRKDPADRYPDVRSFAIAMLAAAPVSMGSTRLLGVRQKPPPLPESARAKQGSAADAPAPSPPARRRFARAPYVTPVRIVGADGAPLDGKSEDISEGGLLVSTDRPCKHEERVEVRFALPTTGLVVRVQAIARWVRSARRNGAVGLEFVDLSTSVREALRAYVKAMGGE